MHKIMEFSSEILVFKKMKDFHMKQLKNYRTVPAKAVFVIVLLNKVIVLFNTDFSLNSRSSIISFGQLPGPLMFCGAQDGLSIIQQ